MRANATRPIGTRSPCIPAKRDITHATRLVNPVFDLVEQRVRPLGIREGDRRPIGTAEASNIVRRILRLVGAVQMAEIPSITPIIRNDFDRSGTADKVNDLLRLCDRFYTGISPDDVIMRFLDFSGRQRVPIVNRRHHRGDMALIEPIKPVRRRALRIDHRSEDA